MKVKFKREGGFAGMTMHREVEQHELPREARRALESLQSVGKNVQRHPGQRRDGFVYTIEFENDNVPTVVAMDEEHVPMEIAPLIRYFESST